MPPEFRPRRLGGGGPVAKRVPTVQGRPETRRRAGGFRWRGAPPIQPPAACRARTIRCRGGAHRSCTPISHPRTGVPQKESRRVGTRRLPYVGDRVGGLGVRPPALGSVIWGLKACSPRVFDFHI